MKRTFALLLLLSLSALFFASDGMYIRISGGWTQSFLTTAERRAGTSETGISGFELSIPVEYRFNDYLSISSGLRYMMRDTRYQKEFENEMVDDYVFMRSFLDLPLMVRAGYGNEIIRCYAGAGGYIGIMFMQAVTGHVSATVSTDITKPGVEYKYVPFEIIDFNSETNLFDAGLAAELGFGIETENGSVDISLRYQYSLTSLYSGTSGSAVKPYIDTLSLSAGYLWRI